VISPFRLARSGPKSEKFPVFSLFSRELAEKSSPWTVLTTSFITFFQSLVAVLSPFWGGSAAIGPQDDTTEQISPMNRAIDFRGRTVPGEKPWKY